MLKNLFKFGKSLWLVVMVWHTTILSSLCVKTGVVSDHFQSANESHDESESTSRWAWLGTLNFKKSTIRLLNWSWLQPTLKKARVSLPNEVLYCRCLITNNKEHYIDWTSSHITMQSRWVIILNSQGQYYGMMSIMRSKRSKEDQMIFPMHPRHHIKVRFFSDNFMMWCFTLEIFVKLNPSWRKQNVSFKGL